MRGSKQIVLFLIFSFITYFCFAQVDRVFWFAAPAITPSHENTPIVFRFTTYAQPATIVIEEPANPSFSPITFYLPSNTAITQDISAQLGIVETKPGNTVLNYGIRITATANISVYYEEGKTFNPEIFPLKGQIGTGTSFLIPSQTRFNNHQPFPIPANNGFAIVATEDSTVLTITLSDNDAAGHSPNIPFTIILLKKGQSYAVNSASALATHHLGGSQIKANKPICVTIYDDSLEVGTSWDLVGDQIVPEMNTGSEFIIVRGALYFSYTTQDYYYIWPTVDNTTIFVDGVQVPGTFNRGQVYEGKISNASSYITTSNPSYVLQFTGVGTEVAATSLPGIKCTGSQTVSFVRSTAEQFYLNILCKTVDIGSFTLNGASNVITPSMFQPVPGTSGIWQAARISISTLSNIDVLIPAGVTTSVANSTGLFHLGFLNGGIATGARLGYFSNYSTIQTSPVVTSASCFGSTIQLSSTHVLGAIYKWSGPNGFSDTVYNPVINKPDLNSSGKYYLTANIYGCGVSTDSVNVIVHALPTASFLKTLDTVCYGNSKNINFSLTGTAPWTFVYSDGAINDTIKTVATTPSSFIASPKISTVYSIKSITDSNTCTVDTITIVPAKDTLIVNPLPLANFMALTALCEKNSAIFKDSSTIGLDSLVSWYWNFGNGRVIKNLTTNTPITIPYAAWGFDTVRMAVQSVMGCKSDTTVRIISIHPLPHVGFTLPEVCLSDASALFTDSTKLADGSLPKLFKWDFDAFTAVPAVPVINFPSPLTSTLQNPSIHYGYPSVYKVKETVTSQNGCIDSLTQAFTVNGSKPKARFTVSDSTLLCSNRTVILTDASTVDFGTVSFEDIYWDLVHKPGMDSIDQNPDTFHLKTHAYSYQNFQIPATQQYLIKLVAHSGMASVCADSTTQIITLHQSPSALFSTLPGICNDTTSRQITQAKETGGVPGSFVYYGSGVNATGIFTPGSVTPGTYPIKYVYISNYGCSDSAMQNQTVWPSPVANWGISSPVCEKNFITFTDSSVANYSNIVNWYWNFGDGTNILFYDANPFTKRYNSANLYTASLRVMTDSGCRSSFKTRSINVHYLPVPNFELPSICLPDGKGQFTDSSNIADGTQSLFSYAWNFGDPNDPTPATIPNPIHKYSAIGPYNVQLKITSKDGCIDSLTKQLMSVYPQPKAGFNIDSAEICMGNNIHFSDASAGYTGSILSWHWDLAESYLSALQNPSRKFSDSGIYKISLFIVDAKGCNSDTIVKTVAIDPYPHLSLIHKMFVLQNGSAQMKPDFYAINPIFNWSPALYLDTATIAYPVTSPLTDITYTFTLTGQGNCSVSDTVLVKVLLAPEVPNVFTPNGDGINDYWVIKYLESYPNCVVQVFDRGGQQVFKSIGYTNIWDGTNNGKPLPVGTYYYIINPKNGRSLMSGSVTIIR